MTVRPAPPAGPAPFEGRCGMAEPEFTATGVRIDRRMRSLTRAGQVLIRDGRLTLLTSYGSEIDSAPVHLVRAGKPWFAAGDRALATVNGNRYLLTLGDQDAPPPASDRPGARQFLDAVRTAGGHAARS